MDKISFNKPVTSATPPAKPAGVPAPAAKPAPAPMEQPPAPITTSPPTPLAPPKPAPAPVQIAAPKPAPAPAPTSATGTAKRDVTLELYQRNARAVFVAGSFNGWDPQATPLRSLAPGKWGVTLHLAPGKYEYRFIIDGKWVEDPLAKESVPNPFGGVNSILSC